MNRMVIAALLLGGLVTGAVNATWADVSDKPRLIVITDIGTEPDDLQSMVRLLTYANDLEIEGLIAATSKHLRDSVHPELIERRIAAYAEALPNLRVHDSSYPDAESLSNVLRTADPLYGMAGVGEGRNTAAAQLIIDAVDSPDPRPLWVATWGGAAPLAQALWTVSKTRTPEEVEAFVGKLRVYAISDQDDAAPWIRMTFPELVWVSSMHGMTQYRLSTWVGITAPEPGSDVALGSSQWANENIRSHGPLGATYPRPIFGIEGDTPSFLYLIPNGLGSPEHPNWGSWGGRYDNIADFLGLWTDTTDAVTGVDGETYRGNKETVWRWRDAYQNDFAARMDWSVNAGFADANHPPQPLLNGEGGLAPVVIEACPGASVTLSAAGSADPDGDALSYRWFWYREVNGLWSPTLSLGAEAGPETTAIVEPWLQPHGFPLPAQYDFHVILSATDNGDPALTRYRRAIVSVPTGGGSVAGTPCPVIDIAETPPFRDFADETISDSGAAYSVANSTIGELLDNPATRAVLAEHLPMVVEMAGAGPARNMTLTGVRHFSSDITDELLEAIDADLAMIPANDDGD